ncbi:hypothetical protein [Candidatus Binatus sp.]|jgi:hypothetical protein|uniref:hypothetical protein n=1 Tax=Candidatus Binatus sp. TaxID=2811406 RepID=UPI003BC2F713
MSKIEDCVRQFKDYKAKQEQEGKPHAQRVQEFRENAGCILNETIKMLGQELIVTPEAATLTSARFILSTQEKSGKYVCSVQFDEQKIEINAGHGANIRVAKIDLADAAWPEHFRNIVDRTIGKPESLDLAFPESARRDDCAKNHSSPNFCPTPLGPGVAPLPWNV